MTLLLCIIAYSPPLRHCVLQTVRGRTGQGQQKKLMASLKELFDDPELHPHGLNFEVMSYKAM